MTKKIFIFTTEIIGYLALLAAGGFLIAEANVAVPFLWHAILIILAIMIAAMVFDVIFKKNRQNILLIIAMCGAMVFIYLFPTTYNRFIGLMVGSYALLNAVINFVEYYIRRKNQLNGILGKLFASFIFLIFALILILAPQKGAGLVFVVAGIYSIIQALINIVFAVLELFGQRKFGLSLPVFLSALLPLNVFMRVSGDDALMAHSIGDPYDDPDINDVPLSVNIYIQGSGFESFGHVDVAIGDTIYSYGLHDPSDRVLWGSAGHGVLVKVDKRAFFKNSLKTGKTMIISYEIYPSKEEMRTIKERLAKLMKDAVPFACNAKLKEEGQKVRDDDYISDVYKDTGCELYKFKSGKFKTYFVFTTNCVLLTDYLIRNKEINLIEMSGIITPGTYINFLYQLYLDPSSIVKGIKIYKKGV